MSNFKNPVEAKAFPSPLLTTMSGTCGKCQLMLAATL